MVCKASTFSGTNEHNKVWHNWNEDVQFAAREYFEPAHTAPGVNDGLAQLLHVVARATDEGQALHAIGSGWAFEDIAASDAWVVSLRRLDRSLGYVVDGGAALTDEWRTRQSDTTATGRLFHVEAGIRIATLCERLESQGFAMPTLGGANGQALAGVVSTSTHGGDWQRPPFPDLVRAVHLVIESGREMWIERASAPITTDARLKPLLPCADTEIIRDDRIFDAVTVACGRFGIVYAYVLEVTTSFRVVEVVTTPSRSSVLKALRDGQDNGTLYTPLFDLLSMDTPPGGLDDATGEPYFFQILFNSQNPNDVWVHRRWVTKNTDDLPPPPPPPTGGAHVTAEASNYDLAVDIVEAANAALIVAAGVVEAIPVVGPFASLYILGLIPYLDGLIASRTFRFGSVVAAVLDTLWKVPAAGYAVPGINYLVLDGRFRPAIKSGRRGPHYLMTSGTRADSDNDDYKADSIELVFDGTTSEYLDFLDDILAVAPKFQQAGYVSLRYSKASRSLLSMHSVAGTHAISIECATLKSLPGNADWMKYAHNAATRRNGRPHWGQYNKLDELGVVMLYGSQLNDWREALLSVSGNSTLFSNHYCRSRGLEPTSIAREVTAARRRSGHGGITHLCDQGAFWSPVAVTQAIKEIESGAIRYFSRAGGKIALLAVVKDNRGGKYLRSQPDVSTADNLDDLPAC
jgi:hypothetical protein